MRADFTAISTHDKLGSLTCFAIINDVNGKRLYGISAAHVLLGDNRHAELRDVIGMHYSKAHLGWIDPAGLLEKAYFINGVGVKPNWGFLDAGSFLIYPKVAKYIKSRLEPLAMSAKLKSPETLSNTIVYGYSVQFNEVLRGEIIDVYHFSNSLKLNFDLQIKFLNGRTSKGDSGMLWRVKNGSAVAMHIYGDSESSYSTLFNRVKDVIGLPLLKLKSE